MRRHDGLFVLPAAEEPVFDATSHAGMAPEEIFWSGYDVAEIQRTCDQDHRCSMPDNLDPSVPPPSDSSDWSEILKWRKAERQRLLDLRMDLTADQRADYSRRIIVNVSRAIGDLTGKTVSLYWPFRGEPDLRDWIADIIAGGGQVALPVVVQKHQPLEFRLWKPGDALERGVWNILVPSEGTKVMPDVVIAPVVGFDAGHFRLGYGGGFFDRTLAAAPVKPLVIGVGYQQARIASIYPQAHDIAMDVIVTEL